MKFTILSYKDKILEIVLTPRVEIIFKSYFQSQLYEEFVTQLIKSCYLHLLPKDVKGKTPYNSSIILNSVNHFEEESEIIGYVAVVFLYEMGHICCKKFY